MGRNPRIQDCGAHCVILLLTVCGLSVGGITVKGQEDKGGSARVRLLLVLMAPGCFCAFEVMGLQVTS